MKDDTRLALLEQSISHINESLIRIEKRFDSVENRLDRIETKVDSNFKWLLAFYIGGFSSLFGIIAHALHWI